MPSPRHEHTDARREALQLLYTGELTGTPVAKLLELDDKELLLIPDCPKGVSENDLVSSKPATYARVLVKGIIESMDELDSLITSTAQNWTIERMPIVDRNIIRIAAYEMIHQDDIPTGVAINEAVEMAKTFGTDESPKFVNGVLGRIATEACDPGTDDTTDGLAR